MGDVKLDVQTIFSEAIEQESPEALREYLEATCGQDAELRAQVERLLESHQQAGNFLEGSSSDDPATVDHPLAEQPGTQIGPYKLLQQIGEGGMGVVYMAEQSEPIERRVALKIIKPGMDTRQVIARFEAERQALAMMDHPNIAKVLDAGTTDTGRPYFVMELVKGVPITDYCDQHQLTPRERLELFLPACQAVQHAHQKGIIHRDIKPSNVMVADYDDRPVPKIIDFGVAKAIEQRLTEKTVFTEFGQVVGTMEYMSPEQAKLNQQDVDTRSDIYSLGVLLYELLVGETPFDGQRLRSAAFDELLRIIREEDPPRPSMRLSTSESLPSIAANRHIEPKQLSTLVRGELDWIVMKALEKDRTRRYETASKFAEDVQHYLNDEAVEACPPSTGYRFKKFARRNKAGIFVSSTITLALLVAIVGLGVSNVRVGKERDRTADALRDRERALEQESIALAHAKKQSDIAVREAAHARQQEGLARRRFYAAQMNLAQKAWESNDPGRVLALLESNRPQSDQDDLRTFEWYYLWRLCHQNLRFTASVPVASKYLHSKGQNRIAISPDGKTLAACGTDGTIKLWELTTGKEQKSLKGYPRGGGRIAFSPSGKQLAQAAGPSGNEATLWDLSTREPSFLEGTGHCSWVAFSPDGQIVVTSGQMVKLWDAETHEELAAFPSPKRETGSLSISSDSKMLAVSSVGHAPLEIWDISEAQPRLHKRLPWQKTVVFLPGGNQLATKDYKGASENGRQVRILDIATGKVSSKYDAGLIDDSSLAVSHDGSAMAFGTLHGRLVVWEPATGEKRILPNGQTVAAVTFSPNGEILASLDVSGKIRVWDLAAQPEPLTLRHQNPGWGEPMTFSPDGETLVISLRNGTIHLRSAYTGESRTTLQGPGGFTGSVAFSPNGRFLASARGAWDIHAPQPTQVAVWDVATGNKLADLQGHPSAVWACVFSPDSKTLASGSSDGTAKLWDLDNFEARATETTRGVQVRRMVYSPDGRFLALGKQGIVILVDSDNGQEVAAADVPTASVRSLAYSPAGSMLAVGTEEGPIRLLEPSTLRLRSELKGNTTAVISLQFFPDGKTLVSGSEDGVVKFWDVPTGQERLSMNGGKFVAISPDGLTLGSLDKAGTLKLWRAANSVAASALTSHGQTSERD